MKSGTSKDFRRTFIGIKTIQTEPLVNYGKFPMTTWTSILSLSANLPKINSLSPHIAPINAVKPVSVLNLEASSPNDSKLSINYLK